MKLTKLTLFSATLFLIALVITPVLNYYVFHERIVEYTNSLYLAHFITTNSELSFDQINSGILAVVLSRDGLLLSISGWFQLLFIISTAVLIKRKKGLINFILSVIFQTLAILGVIALIVFYNRFNIQPSFFIIQTYILLALVITSTVIFIIFSYFFIRSRYRAIMPITQTTILNAIYNLLRFITVLVIIVSLTVIINSVILYNIAAFAVSQINIEAILDLPPIIRLNLVSVLNNSDTLFDTIISSLTYKQGIFELLNGELIIKINQLSSTIQNYLSSYVDKYFNTLLTNTFIFIGLFSLFQFFNFLHKKLKFENVIAISLLIITLVVSYFVLPLPKISLVYSIKVLMTILVVLYLLIFIDYKLYNYKYIKKGCKFINNFTLSNSFNSFVGVIKNCFNDVTKYFKKKSKHKKKKQDKAKNGKKKTESKKN